MVKYSRLLVTGDVWSQDPCGCQNLWVFSKMLLADGVVRAVSYLHLHIKRPWMWMATSTLLKARWGTSLVTQ